MSTLWYVIRYEEKNKLILRTLHCEFAIYFSYLLPHFFGGEFKPVVVRVRLSHPWFQLDIDAIVRPCDNGDVCLDLVYFFKRDNLKASNNLGQDSFFFHLSKLLSNTVPCTSREGNIGIRVHWPENARSSQQLSQVAKVFIKKAYSSRFKNLSGMNLFGRLQILGFLCNWQVKHRTDVPFWTLTPSTTMFCDALRPKIGTEG